MSILQIFAAVIAGVLLGGGLVWWRGWNLNEHERQRRWFLREWHRHGLDRPDVRQRVIQRERERQQRERNDRSKLN